MHATVPLVFAVFATLTVAHEFSGEIGRESYSDEHGDEHGHHVKHYGGEHYGHGHHARYLGSEFPEASWFEDRHKKHDHNAKKHHEKHAHNARSIPSHFMDGDNFDPSPIEPKTAHHNTMTHYSKGSKPTDAPRSGWEWLGYKQHHAGDADATATAHGAHEHPIDEYGNFHRHEGHHGQGNHWERDTETVAPENEFFDASDLQGYDWDDEEDEDDAAIYARDAHHHSHHNPHHNFGDDIIYPRGVPADTDDDEENDDQAYYDAGDDGDNDFLDGTVTDDDTEWPNDDVGDLGYAEEDDDDEDDAQSGGVFARSMPEKLKEWSDFKKHGEHHHHHHPTAHKTKPAASKGGWNLFPW